jgi:hypothetical protein
MLEAVASALSLRAIWRSEPLASIAAAGARARWTTATGPVDVAASPLVDQLGSLRPLDRAVRSSEPPSAEPDKRREDLLGESVPVRARHPPDVDVAAPLQLVGERVTMGVHRGDDRGVSLEERPNRVAEPRRGELHLPQLVDHHHAALRDVLEGGERDALELFEVHAVLADSRPAPIADVGQGALLSGRSLDPETTPVPALADRTGQESGDGDSGLAERSDQPPGDGALTDPGTALEKQASRRAQRS